MSYKAEKQLFTLKKERRLISVKNINNILVVFFFCFTGYKVYDHCRKNYKSRKRGLFIFLQLLQSLTRMKSQSLFKYIVCRIGA